MDLVAVLVFISVTCVILVLFNVPAFTANDNLGAVILLLAAYCTASISMVYCLEKLFRGGICRFLQELCQVFVI